MPVARGDIALADVEFIIGSGTKIRPVLVIQNDRNNRRLKTTIVAAVTSNTRRTLETSQMLIDLSTSDGAKSGLLYNSAVKAEHLVTIEQIEIHRVIGHLPDSLMKQFDDCLKSSLGIS